jgi:PAS domain S-box-containing protein
MTTLLGDNNAVYKMTLASERYRSLGLLDTIVRLIGNPRLVYSQAPKYNKLLKLNGTVVIHDMGDDWVLLEDRYNDSSQKTRYDCDYTRGVIAGIPTMFGLPEAEVEEIECQVAQDRYGIRIWPDKPRQGCRGCLYRVQWRCSQAAPFWKRFWNRRKSYREAIEELQRSNQLIQNKYDEVSRLAAQLDTANRQLVAQKEALLASEKQYRVLADNVTDIIWTLDLATLTFDYVSPSVERTRGYTAAEARQLSLEETLSPESLAHVSEIMARELEQDGHDGVDPQRSRTIEIQESHKDGTYGWAEVTVSFVRDSKGHPTAIMGVTRDIAERKHAQEALRESEEKYRELVQYAPAGIYEFDLENMRFTSVNDVMCTYTGYTREEFLGLDPYRLIAEESLGAAAETLQKVFAGETELDPVEYKIKSKSGRVFWVLVNSKVFFKDGKPIRSMSVVHDVTLMRQSQEERRKLEIQLQNAQKLESLGTLAGGVAHDLNNILSGVVSYPELLLLDLEPDSPLYGPLLAIKKSGEKAAEIVQDLLTLARRGVATKKSINCNRIVGDFLNSPEYRSLIAKNDQIAVETHLAPDSLNLAGSALHISKTLMNLVANAIDAMPSGGAMTIATMNRYVDRPYTGFETIPEGEYTLLRVSDHGIGMPPEDLARIFEPFYTRKSMGRSGTGLGMSVVWGTVKDHDGFIDIQTEEGRGTTFDLYFPASRSEAEIEAPVYIDDYVGKGESILVVDDSRAQRELAARMMQRLGYEVQTAPSGEDALAALSRQRFDLLILDMIMDPGMDGLETFKAVLEKVPGQKAIIASGYSESERVRAMQNLGAGGYVKKPFTLEKIGMAVRSELDRA